MNAQVRAELLEIVPFDATEQQHFAETLAWINSGASLFRLEKPATPPKHLVSYFVVVDGSHILLVDHKNAQLWLPTGGHVEPGEHPRETVVRELKEELGLVVARTAVGPPLMVTVTETVGLTAGHTDVLLWYVVQGCRSMDFVFDCEEFNEVRWFKFSEAPVSRSDPHLARFLRKLVPPEA